MDKISNETTKKLLKDNPEFKSIFKTLLGSFKTKKDDNYKSIVMSPGVVRLFNGIVDRINCKISSCAETDNLSFDSYLNTIHKNDIDKADVNPMEKPQPIPDALTQQKEIHALAMSFSDFKKKEEMGEKKENKDMKSIEDMIKSLKGDIKDLSKEVSDLKKDQKDVKKSVEDVDDATKDIAKDVEDIDKDSEGENKENKKDDSDSKKNDSKDSPKDSDKKDDSEEPTEEENKEEETSEDESANEEESADEGKDDKEDDIFAGL